jgi:hypothetical protein
MITGYKNMLTELQPSYWSNLNSHTHKTHHWSVLNRFFFTVYFPTIHFKNHPSFYILTKYGRTPLLRSCNLHFPIICNIFFRSLQFPNIHNVCNIHNHLPWFHISKISNLPQFSSVEHLQREKFWHKMASTDIVSTYFYMFCHVLPSVGQPSS